MTNKDKYIRLCERETLPLHMQAWWWEKSTIGKEWDVLLLENAKGQIDAAMPYQIVKRFCLRAILMPVHTQYHSIYISPDASDDIYQRFAQHIAEFIHKEHISWISVQGFYPAAFLEEIRKQGFAIQDRITYRIDQIPTLNELPDLFSKNKRRQLKKAKDMQLVDLSVDDFYAFHANCMCAQGKKIDYSKKWAGAVIPEVLAHKQGRLIAAQDNNGTLLASIFLAWDTEYSYFLLPSYNPDTKDRGAVAWLTAQALEITRNKGLRFDFEGSMTPSIASSYQQFGGQPVVYHSIEKFNNPFLRSALWLSTTLRNAHFVPAR